MNKLIGKRTLASGAGLLGLLIVLGALQTSLLQPAEAQTDAKAQAPKFEVDPLWPKPLPNHWVLGQAVGVAVDADDHIWIVHRGSGSLAEQEKGLEEGTTELCCAGAPEVLEFDQAGNLLRHWGGPVEGAEYEWPDGVHGITIDYKGNVWIGGNSNADSHILKFTKDGKFLLQVGQKGARYKEGVEGIQLEGYDDATNFLGDSSDTLNFGRVAKISVDPKTNEAYVADGYLNKRVAVIDADTGEMKRFWGAYGNKPDDSPLPPYDPDKPAAQQFYNPVHCADLSTDQFVYVCDRAGDRLQVFTPEGEFVKEGFFAKNTMRSGSVWDIAFSTDPEQKYIFMADGMNNIVRIVDRQSLEEITTFGDGGRQPGQFYGVHSIAIDSKGNLYTTETWEGKRLQKFVNKGVMPVSAVHQGVVWPVSQ